MERIEDLTLVSVKTEKDEINQEIEVESKRVVVCSVSSVTRAEFFDAGQSGLKAEVVCFLRDSADYEDEERAILNSKRYVIYRTYLTSYGGIELYLRKDVGA